MKEVRKFFLRLAVLKHLDKLGRVNADFLQLEYAYDKVRKLIQETEQADTEDDDETVARKLFIEIN